MWSAQTGRITSTFIRLAFDKFGPFLNAWLPRYGLCLEKKEGCRENGWLFDFFSYLTE